MKVAVFSTKRFDRSSLDTANATAGHALVYLEPGLDEATAPLAHGYPGVCAFVNDRLSAPVLRTLHAGGTRLIALRSAGFNNVDLDTADALGMTVLRVPAYSPHSVAEHTVGLILTLNRKFHRAYNRVREQNFSLDGLMGFDLHGRTVGVVGTGKIGTVVVSIMRGFGCRVLAYDPHPCGACRQAGGTYVDLPQLLKESDIVSLHAPLTPQTYHVIDEKALTMMKTGVMLINTSRGALVDSAAVIAALKNGKIGYLGLDVYEEEGDLFFRDLSDRVITDDVFARLQTFPNVVITAHQAFFTREAVGNIAQTTIENITGFERGGIKEQNRVTPTRHAV